MHSGVEIVEDDDSPGAIVSFPFDAEFVARFRLTFPRARWNEQLRAWRLPGTTAVRRATRWLERNLPSAFAQADERGHDSFSFEPIVSRYLSCAEDLVVRTPYSRTVVEELRAVPWAWWNGEEKAWHVPFRSVDELRKRWPAIEAAAKRNEPEARRQRQEAAKREPGHEEMKARANEQRRHRYPVLAGAMPPLDTVVMSHAGPLVIKEVTGEIVPEQTAHQHYVWSTVQPGDLVWTTWRRPTHDELIRTWPARQPPAAGDLSRGWWQPTLAELRAARRAARSLERARETRKRRASSRDRAG